MPARHNDTPPRAVAALPKASLTVFQEFKKWFAPVGGSLEFLLFPAVRSTASRLNTGACQGAFASPELAKGADLSEICFTIVTYPLATASIDSPTTANYHICSPMINL